MNEQTKAQPDPSTPESSPKRPGTPYRLDIAYMGTPYHGWQSQTSGRTLQDHLEKALEVLLRHPVQTIAASRTDSGVHAEQQVVLFRTDQPFAEERWVRSLNGLLPESMGILNISPVPEGFHPIYSAKGKVYRYRIWKGSSRHPQWAPITWNVHRPLDVAAMGQAAESFIGSHDFTSFCAVDSSAKTRTRHVYGIHIVESGPLVEIWVFGKGFLKQMVRIMVGTLVEIGVGRRPAYSIPDILRGQNRALAGKTAPAQGLSLVRVFYGELPSPGDFHQS